MTTIDDRVYDFAVIGAGIAGTSIAAHLGEQARVIVLEREEQPGYHTTGRSAAMFIETYGPPAVRVLTRASRAFLTDPPEGFSDTPLLAPRDVMMVARADQALALDAHEASAGPTVERLMPDRAIDLVPALRRDYLHAALLEPDAREMDVAALHGGYRRLMRRRGADLLCNAEVRGAQRVNGAWELDTPQGTVRAATIVNAAGAWADVIGEMLGARPIGLIPKRRTAVTFDAVLEEDSRPDVGAWPLVACIDEEFYFRPEAGRIMASPADETPSPPCDAQPDDMDIALLVDKLETATRFSISRLHSRWAGLRSFVADKEPVIGADPEIQGLFWMAGQGGYGIQTAAAAGQCGAALATGSTLPAEAVSAGLSVAAIAPDRLARA